MATKAATRKKPAGQQFIFKPFDERTFAATREAWTTDAATGEGFAPEVEQVMTWVGAHIALTDNEMAYGVFREKSAEALGICETAITKPTARGKWVKLLRLRLRPQIEGMIFENDVEGTSIALNAYVAAVLGVYHVKNQHQATTIKIYGRTQEQMRFLTLLQEALKQRAVNFEAVIQGRWLVLNWREK